MVPEESGGVGAGQEEAMMLMQEAGAALCIEPLLATAVMSAPLLAQAASNPIVSEALEATLEGRASLALAWSENHFGFRPLEIQTRAINQGNGRFVLSGEKVLVDNGATADWIIIPARTDDANPDDPLNGISLFVVSGNAQGLVRKPAQMVDGSWAADLSMDEMPVGEAQLIGEWGQGGAALQAAVYRGVAANCAQALGAMGRSLEICRDYLQERKQFGQTLNSFQALQHRYVDMLIAEERAKSMMLAATIRAAEQEFDRPESVRDFSLAQQVVGQAARMVGANAIQLHGGMGMCLEYPIGHYYRKLLYVDTAFGTPDDHLSQLVEMDMRNKESTE